MKQCTAVILCGGAAARLQGVDKPLRPLLGRPLLEHVLERIRPQVDAMIVVANRSLQDYSRYASKVVDDGAYRGRGPLAGIAAGLAAAGEAEVVCVPGDAPLLPPDLVTRLHMALQRESADAALVHDGQGRQPLCSLLQPGLLPGLLRYLEGGGSAPRDWLGGLRVAEADCRDWPRWAWSLNTAEEWEQVERHLRQSRNATP